MNCSKTEMSQEHLQKIPLQNAQSSSTLLDRSLDPYSKWYDKSNSTDQLNDVKQTIHIVNFNGAKDSTNKLKNKFLSISCAGTFLPVISDQTLPYSLDNISLWNNSQEKILVENSVIDNNSIIHNFVEDETVTNRHFSLQTDIQQEIALTNNETKTSNLDCITTSNENYPDTPIPLYVLSKTSPESPIFKNSKSISQEIIYKGSLYFNDYGRKNVFPVEKVEENNIQPIALRKSQQLSFQDSHLDENVEVWKNGDNSLCKNYETEESFVENQLIFQNSSVFGSKEIVYEGIGENFLKYGSLQDEVEEKPSLQLEVQSTYASYEEKMVGFFQECSPDKDGYVLKETLAEKLVSNQDFNPFFLESWSFLLKDTGPKISYEIFYSTIIKLGENLLLSTNMEDYANKTPESNSSINEPVCSPYHQENNEQFMPVFNSCKCSNDAGECSEENRRSTLLPGQQNFLPNIKSEMSSYLSPIKPFMGMNSEKYLYKRAFDHIDQDKFDYTIGSVETEANLTQLDPLVLQNEVFELTYANQKLTGEKDELAANLSKSEEEYNTLTDKISKLEAALNLAELQALESQNKLRELNEVKLLLETKNEIVDKYLLELKQVQTEKQELENHIKKLNMKISYNHEIIDDVLKKEKEKCIKIEELTIKIIRMKDEKKKYCVELEKKDEEIEYLNIYCDNSKLEMQSQKEEKRQILEELQILKIKMSKEFLTKKNFEGRSLDVSLDAMEDSCLEGIQNINIIDELQDNDIPLNIKDEIILMDLQDSLPFCEKRIEFGLSPERYEGVSLKDALDKWCFWNDKSINLAKACSETSDNYELLLQHIRNLSFWIETWRNILKGDCLSRAFLADQKNEIAEIDATSVCSSEKTLATTTALEVPTTDNTIAVPERFIANERRTNASIIFECVILLIFILIIWFMLLMKSASDMLWSPNSIYKSDELLQLVIPSIPFVQLRQIGIPPV